MSISEIIAHIFLAACCLIFVGFIFLVLRAFYLRISYKFKPYSKKVVELNKRRNLANNTGNYKDLQQVALEQLWLDCHKFGRINNIPSDYPNPKSQYELEDAAYVELSKTIQVSDFILPNVHNVYTIPFAYDFLDDILHRTEDVRSKSSYSDTYYFPESILPYPKEYLRFALDNLFERYYKSESKNDITFKFFVEKKIDNLRYFDELLNTRAINVSSDLLSTEKISNEQYGDRVRGKVGH